MNDKVAIVGTHSKTRSLAPYDDPSVDIWVLNESATDAPDGERWVKRCDAVFQMHDPMVFESLHNLSDPKHYEWLRQPHEFPIWMQEANPDIPASVKYPREEMKEELFCNFYQGLKQKDREVYDSSMDFAIALAVHLGYKEIQIYGVEVEADTEYLRQREGIKFWHGYALGRGITVRTYCGDAMFDRPVYGYEVQFARILKNTEPERRNYISKSWSKRPKWRLPGTHTIGQLRTGTYQSGFPACLN